MRAEENSEQGESSRIEWMGSYSVSQLVSMHSAGTYGHTGTVLHFFVVLVVVFYSSLE